MYLEALRMGKGRGPSERCTSIFLCLKIVYYLQIVVIE